MNEQTPKPPRKIWFPAKTYGWGWGPPVCWQGWAVTAGYVAALALGAGVIFRDPKAAPQFVVYALALSAALVAVCWWKGEEPKWRWGEKSRERDRK